MERDRGVVVMGACCDSGNCCSSSAEDAEADADGMLGLPVGDPWAEVAGVTEEEEEVGVATG